MTVLEDSGKTLEDWLEEDDDPVVPEKLGRFDRLVSRNRYGGYSTDAVEDVKEGVTVGWLAVAFELTEPDVRKRLRHLRPAKVVNRSNIYNFRQALDAIQTPTREQISQYLENARSKDIPDTFRSAFWDAKTKQRKYLEDARDLWHTNDVRDLFVGVLKEMREELRSWMDTVEEQSELTNKQRSIILSLTDHLKNKLSTRIDNFVSERESKSYAENDLQ